MSNEKTIIDEKVKTEEQMESTEVETEDVQTDEVDPIVERDQQIAELKDKLLRNAAEVENFKRRINEERIKERKYASQNIIGQLLPVLDNLERATTVNVENQELINFLQGFKMIYSSLTEILKNEGVEVIDEVNAKFDPNVHQAVLQEESAEHESDIVIEVLQKGFKYKDRVVRPAMVKVSK